MTTSPANSPVNTASSHSTSPVSAASSGSFWSDMKILWHMIVRQGRGQTHEERLEDFYKGQASGYDSFRKRLLHGKKDLFDQLPAPPGGVWVDLGAGTGENAENWGERLNEFSNVYLVDLSSSLLKVAQARIEQRGWQNVKAIHHDATTFLPPEGMADVVTFSYSLTMIPDWHKAVDQAIRMLKPGGGAGNCRFLCQPQISPRRECASCVVDTSLLADLVCDRQRLSFGRSSALPAKPSGDSRPQRAAWQSALHAVCESTALCLCWS